MKKTQKHLPPIPKTLLLLISTIHLISPILTQCDKACSLCSPSGIYFICKQCKSDYKAIQSQINGELHYNCEKKAEWWIWLLIIGLFLLLIAISILIYTFARKKKDPVIDYGFGGRGYDNSGFRGQTGAERSYYDGTYGENLGNFEGGDLGWSDAGYQMGVIGGDQVVNGAQEIYYGDRYPGGQYVGDEVRFVEQ